jgi:hypothetical protein
MVIVRCLEKVSEWGSLRFASQKVIRDPAEHEQKAVFARLYSSDRLSIAGGLPLPAD